MRTPIPAKTRPHPRIRRWAGCLALTLGAAAVAASLVPARAEPARDPGTTIWACGPAERWENAHPVGNGRLGAMVFGRTDEELIQLNEDTYWTGGPYTTTVKSGAEALPEIRRLVFEGRLKQAHVLFGRRLMGYPVEQQKYQSLGNLVLGFPEAGGRIQTRPFRHRLPWAGIHGSQTGFLPVQTP